jgi:hypothetical protein
MLRTIVDLIIHKLNYIVPVVLRINLHVRPIFETMFDISIRTA